MLLCDWTHILRNESRIQMFGLKTKWVQNTHTAGAALASRSAAVNKEFQITSLLHYVELRHSYCPSKLVRTIK